MKNIRRKIMNEFDEKDLKQVKECLEDYALEYMGKQGLLDYFVHNEITNNLESREEYIQRGWILEEDYE
jgi:sugar phosphate isomerase/epimerase